jgi:multidrug efflux pump
MSFITRFGLNKDRVTIVFIIMVILLGIQQFMVFPRQEDPPIVIREIVVSTYFPGMNPPDMRELVTRTVEAELRTLPEIKDIWSDTKNGTSVVHADTRDQYDDLDLIWQKVRNKMADLKTQLPEGTIGPFVNDEFGLTAVATIALTGEGFSMAEMRLVARDIRDRLYELNGIRKIELWGVQNEQVFLKFSTSKLTHYGISINQIKDTLVKQNVILPGGKIDAAGRDIILEPSGNFRNIEDIRQMLISVNEDDNSNIQLMDLLEVERGYSDPAKDLAYFKGRPAVVISVSITPGVNSVEFGERLTRKIQAIESHLPIGYQLEYATFQPDLVVDAVNGALSNVYQTLAIVLVVVMLFLGLRTGLIVGSFVPMTMLMGLILMRFSGVELERVSIASAIIALGMLVDNGIVVAEDIRTRLERGEEKRKACIDSGSELAIPLLTSSLTTIFAFMPMLLMNGSTGEYVYSLPVVVIILLLGSWFLSMFMTPVVCYWFMKIKKNNNSQSGKSTRQADQDPYSGKFYRVYRSLLGQLLRFRYVVLVATGLIFLLGGLASTFLVREMFGPGDRKQFLVYIDLPAGYNIKATDHVVKQVTSWLSDEKQNPEIESSIAYVGTGGPRFFLSLSPFDPDPHRAFIIVNTKTGDQVKEMIQRVRRYFDDQVPEAVGRISQMWMGSTEPGIVEVRLIGPDAETLFVKGGQLLDDLKKMPGLTTLRSDWENKVLKLQMDIDQARARRAGITSQDFATSLQANLDGIKVTEYREADVAIPVLLRSVEEERKTAGDIRNFSVFSSAGVTNAPALQIARGRSGFEFSRIANRNQELTLTVECRHERLRAPELFAVIEPLVEKLDLSPEYRWEVGGEIEEALESNEKLTRYMLPCFFGIVFLLIWQFNSFRRPLIILFTIPLAFSGAIIGVMMVRAPFDFFAILGLLSLAGVIINNGIVLIDRIDTERSQGREPYDAILLSALSRFRPILMTTVTTVLGVMPFVIYKDPLFFTLAIVIAFGLVCGTVLTLGVVPVLYSILFGVKKITDAKN